MKKNVLLFASLFVMLFISCNDDDPSTKSTFSIQQKQLVYKTSSANKQTSTTLGSFSFSKVLIGVSKIEFEKEYEINDVEIEEEIEYTGNFSFDVLNGTSSPAIPSIDIEAGVYHELEFKVDTVLANGNSIEIFGSYNDGNYNYLFEFSSTIVEEFEIENENGINLNVNETVNFVLMLELETLFKSINFTTLLVDSDNVIRINPSSNSEIYSQIEDNLEDIMDFEDDDDN